MKLVSFAAAVVMGLATQAAQASPLATLEDVLSTYNVMVFGDMGTAANPYSSDSQGAVAVGGNAYLRDFTVAVNSNHGADALTVGGNLDQLRAEDHGNVFVGGNADFHDGMQGGATIFGTLTVDGTLVHAPTQYVGTPLVGPSPIDFNAIRSDILTASQQLATAALGSVGTVAFNNQWNQRNLSLTGTSTGLNVFNVDGSLLSMISSGSFQINVPDNATVLINVSGTSITIGNPGNFGFFCDSPSNYCSNSVADGAKILFNFYQATSISMQSMLGSILAPLADVTYTNGQMLGTLVANSVSGPVWNTGEFHDVSFTGILAVGVPGPGALSLLLLGLIPLAGLRRRAAV